MKIIFALLQLIALVPIVKNWETLKLGSKSRIVSIAISSLALVYFLYALTDFKPIFFICIFLNLVVPVLVFITYRKEILDGTYRLLILIPIIGMVVPLLLTIQHYPGAWLMSFFQYFAALVSVYIYFKDSESKLGILHSSLMVYLIIQSLIQIKLRYL